MAMNIPTLTPMERPWAHQLYANKALWRQLKQVLPGPFHVLHPATFAENLADFQHVFHAAQVNGAVYFGKKANKAGCWIREVAQLNGCVDVASVEEFTHALGNGIRGESIGVTGAAKSDDLLWLAARHGALVAIDALDELERAIAIAAYSERLRLLLRVLPPAAPHSRFGLAPQALQQALERCAQAREVVVMAGLAFHLDGYQPAARAELAHQLLENLLLARALGLCANTLSIGGGFACAYLSAAEWRAFQAQNTPALFHAERSFEHFYPYYQSPTGAAMLKAILAAPGPRGNLAQALKSLNVKLLVEPGRALLDGAGISVFPVQGFKQQPAQAHGIVTVAGLSMSLSEQWKHSEFLPSPRLLQCGPLRPQRPVQAAIGGASCMEYDMLSWRKIPFPAPPHHGDLIVYPNTAGYQMDKNESEFHQLPLPPKVVLREQEGAFAWTIDR